MVFLIILMIVLNLFAFLMPKKFSGIEMLCTTLFAMYLELIVNLFLDIKYDLFGYFTKGVDRKSLYYLFGIYPAINILFINFFQTGSVPGFSILQDGRSWRWFLSFCSS